MQHVLVRLKLEDYAKWRPAFDGMANFRKTSGCTGGHLFQKSDDPNEVAILFEWESLEKARQYFQSDALRQAMQRGGVSGPPDVQFLNEGEKLPM